MQTCDVQSDADSLEKSTRNKQEDRIMIKMYRTVNASKFKIVYPTLDYDITLYTIINFVTSRITL